MIGYINKVNLFHIFIVAPMLILTAWFLKNKCGVASNDENMKKFLVYLYGILAIFVIAYHLVYKGFLMR